MENEDRLTQKDKLALSVGALYVPITIGALLQNFLNNEWVIVLAIIAYLISLIYILSSN